MLVWEPRPAVVLEPPAGSEPEPCGGRSWSSWAPVRLVDPGPAEVQSDSLIRLLSLLSPQLLLQQRRLLPPVSAAARGLRLPLPGRRRRSVRGDEAARRREHLSVSSWSSFVLKCDAEILLFNSSRKQKLFQV